MLKMRKVKIALWVTLAMTAIATVLRVTLIPYTQDMETGAFHISYVVVAAMVLTLVAAAFLLIKGKEELPTLPSVRGAWLTPIACVVMLVGVCLLVVAAVDMYRWAALGVTPPPTKMIIGTVDRLTLFFSLVFGVLSGTYFIRLGWLWLQENREMRGVMHFWALCPTVWIWMRLARYEVSYASAVEIYESFYDFAMLLLMMLFLFAFARWSARVGEERPRRLLFYALGTALMAISGPIARMIFYLIGEGDAYRAGQLAGLSDFAIGLFAAVMALYWVLEKPEGADAAEPEEQPTSIVADAATEDMAEPSPETADEPSEIPTGADGDAE